MKVCAEEKLNYIDLNGAAAYMNICAYIYINLHIEASSSLYLMFL
jgi:hypothetical protein